MYVLALAHLLLDRGHALLARVRQQLAAQALDVAHELRKLVLASTWTRPRRKLGSGGLSHKVFKQTNRH